jgi:hypothetical protein
MWMVSMRQQNRVERLAMEQLSVLATMALFLETLLAQSSHRESQLLKVPRKVSCLRRVLRAASLFVPLISCCLTKQQKYC